MRTNKLGLKISLSELEKRKSYDWPGNIRELENVIERQVILTRGETVNFSDMNLLAVEDTDLDSLSEENRSDTAISNRVDSYRASLQAFMTEGHRRNAERENIIQALKRCAGKVSGNAGAAALIGVKSTTLSSRIKKYRINPKEYKQSY